MIHLKNKQTKESMPENAICYFNP